jgi:SAM-dependent methyltransferase
MRIEKDKSSWLQRAIRPLQAAFSKAPPSPEPKAYEYQPAVADISYEEGVALIEARGHPVVKCGVDSYSPGVVESVRRKLVETGVPTEEYAIDVERFERFRQQADYAARYPDYYGARMAEKHLEHFVTHELLGLSTEDVVIDIASEDSPVPDIFARITGAQTYWQDIQYEPGINGRRIGGDACNLPLPDGFATAAALTCSLEHFERNADTLLCGELGRVLRPGGRLVIAPLYMFPEPVTQTDPVYSAQADVPFDAGTIYCAKDWRNRHGRFYSPETLRERVLGPLQAVFDCTVKVITNWQQISDHTYLRFALFCRRR